MIPSSNANRLVIAHNPNSSRAGAVQKLVFDRLDAAGYGYEKIEVRQASLADNVARLAPFIQPGDIILSAAGDGSAHAVFHTVLAADQPGVQLGFLAFGNFNDIPHAFNSRESMQDPVAFLENAKPVEAWPLQVLVDDKPLRSALLYVTAGWTAQAAAQFDNPAVRSRIRRGSFRLAESMWRLGLYYLKTRRLSLLPPFRYQDIRYDKATDLIFANGPSIARLFRTSKRYYQEKYFLYRSLDVRKLLNNAPFLAFGLVGRMQGEKVESVSIRFDMPSDLPLQCDGEVVMLKNITSLEVQKSVRSLEVLTTR